MKARLSSGVIHLVGAATLATGLAIGQASAKAAPDAATVLGTSAFWRCHLTWKTEQVRRQSGDLAYEVYTVRRGKGTWRALEPRCSALPAAEWTRPDFDDTSWARACGPFDKSSMGARVKSPWPRTLALLCLRGTFEVTRSGVFAQRQTTFSGRNSAGSLLSLSLAERCGRTDSARAGDLTLDLAFRGGAVVYLNGEEVARAHLPKGTIDFDTPAEDYPHDVYLRSDGMLLRMWYDAKLKDAFAQRIRRISGVKIPASLLREGRNVLAVELHRAPTDEVFYTATCRTTRAHAAWSMLSLESLRLAAASDGAAVGAAVRPQGIQVWNADPMHKVRATSCGIPGETLRPIRLVAARNGAFSGQVVVSSTAPIRGLKAAVTDLKGGRGATIPASAVEIRYARLDGPDSLEYFDGLEESAPVEVPVIKEGGAVQPVWVTVHVPRNAPAGVYTGTLTITGPTTVDVPMELTVADWALPDPEGFTSFLGVIQSPETLAKYYNVPMWSEEHWKLIDRSFELMGRLGSDTVYIHLIRRTYFGNQHGMVRWIRKQGSGDPRPGASAGGMTPRPATYMHDFSIAERYLDAAVKHLGKVPVVCLSVWHAGIGGSYFGLGGSKGPKTDVRGIPFTVLDPASGTLEEAVGPKWGEPAVREFWKPVIDGMREILKKRGLEKSMMVGWGTDIVPNKRVVEDLKSVAPEAPWVVQRHPFTRNLHGAPVGYLVHVWGTSITPLPSSERVYGWKNPRIETVFPRYGCSIVGHSLRLWTALPAYRLVMEAAVTSPGKRHTRRGGRVCGDGLRGIGRLGADFWPVPGRKPRGRKSSVHGSYPESCKGDGALNLSYSVHRLLAPGRDGAIATVRFENVREGLQETEARIFIEKALIDPAKKARLGADLAGRCQEVLDDRTVALVRARDGANAGRDDPGWLWFIGSGWQQRSAGLYAAAAAVAAQIHEAAEAGTVPKFEELNPTKQTGT